VTLGKALTGLNNVSDLRIIDGNEQPAAGRNRRDGEGQLMKISLWAGVVALVFVADGAIAGPILTACNQSSRQAATPAMCRCIERVADHTLRGSDQRRVATFFRDPDKAQSVRMSQTRADDAFWERYKAFVEQAEASCAG
jgi:hypothetical protein